MGISVENLLISGLEKPDMGGIFLTGRDATQETELYLEGGHLFVAHLTREQFARLPFEVGQQVYVEPREIKAFAVWLKISSVHTKY